MQRRDDQQPERIVAGRVGREGRLDDRVLGVEAGKARRCGMPTPVSASVPMSIIA